MTLHSNPDIVCDWPGCYSRSSELYIYQHKAAELRAALAAKRGWSQIASSDFCGHHPTLADHKPILKKVTEGWTTGWRSSCSCGWNVKDERPGSWPGERSTAIFWWQRHLPEETHSACMELFMAEKKAIEEAM